VATEDEDALLRALSDPDPAVQRMAAVRARKVSLPSAARVLTALEALLAHEDKYLRRAAAASYVAMHPRGPAAPALRPLHQDPAEVVVLTARGSLLDRGHERAELEFVVRALAYATRLVDASRFGATIRRWHRFLWNYSPNPHAAVIARTLVIDELERDAEHLREAIATPHEDECPRDVTMLRFELLADGLGVRGFVHGQATWRARTLPAKLPALRRLVDFTWDVDDAPWDAMFAAGAFALAVAPAVDAASTAWLGDAHEREITTCVGAREQIFLGFLHPTGITFTDEPRAVMIRA
jgi:hypothetical protein